MMTPIEASDAINTLFYTAWQTGTPSIVGYTPEARFQGLIYRDLPDADKYWSRITQFVERSGQKAFGPNVGSISKRRFLVEGFVIIQIFCPTSESDSYRKGEMLATLVRNAFRGKNVDCLWFRNASFSPLPPEKHYNRFSVKIDFQYDEIG